MATLIRTRAKVAIKEKEESSYVVRFSVSQRVEHMVLMVSFIVLAVTGLAQRFYTGGAAEWIILNLGGVENVRLIHRIFGVLFTLSAVYHFWYLFRAFFIRHSKPVMLPSLRDFRDVVMEIKHTFGLSHEKPRFGRFDYRQKFEYWGIIFGGLIMIVTGFALAYPTAFTSILPGQFIAAAKEFHRNEAMLAVLTIVVWHLYDVIFKPGVFPLNTSIFTGRISKERMREEHPLDYAEVVGTEKP